MQTQEELAPHVDEITRALDNKVDREQVVDELKKYLEYGVDLSQAKRDIVRNHGGGGLGGGDRSLEALTPGERGVDLRVRVLTVNPKDIEVKGEPKRIWYGFLADATGRVPYTAWKDHGLEEGASAEVKNVYVKEGYRGEGVEVNIGDYATVEALDEEVPVAEGVSAAGGGGEAVERPIKELGDGYGNVTVTARVLELNDKTVNSQGEEKRILVGELADATGKIPFTAWHEFPMEEGQVVRIENGYVKSFRNVPNLNFGENATVEVLEDDALPPTSELSRDKPFTVGELEGSGGATGVLVDGVLLEVKKGSGLIFRCPECNRVLQKRECRVHGKVEGNPDLRVKAVLDDGTGALTVIMLREVTEAVMGKSLKEYQEMAREAMTHEVVMDEVVDRLTARTMRVHGNVTSDEYGLMLIASEATFAKLEDVSETAEKLLYEIQEAV